PAERLAAPVVADERHRVPARNGLARAGPDRVASQTQEVLRHFRADNDRMAPRQRALHVVDHADIDRAPACDPKLRAGHARRRPPLAVLVGKAGEAQRAFAREKVERTGDQRACVAIARRLDRAVDIGGARDLADLVARAAFARHRVVTARGVADGPADAGTLVALVARR